VTIEVLNYQIIVVKKKIDKKRGTVCSHGDADDLFKNMPSTNTVKPALVTTSIKQ
jgi:hypothetical protein